MYSVSRYPELYRQVSHIWGNWIHLQIRSVIDKPCHEKTTFVPWSCHSPFIIWFLGTIYSIWGRVIRVLLPACQPRNSSLEICICKDASVYRWHIKILNFHSNMVLSWCDMVRWYSKSIEIINLNIFLWDPKYRHCMDLEPCVTDFQIMVQVEGWQSFQ